MEVDRPIGEVALYRRFSFDGEITGPGLDAAPPEPEQRRRRRACRVRAGRRRSSEGPGALGGARMRARRRQADRGAAAAPLSAAPAHAVACPGPREVRAACEQDPGPARGNSVLMGSSTSVDMW